MTGSSSDRQLAEAIEYAKAAMATGTIPEAVDIAVDNKVDVIAQMRVAKESTTMSKGGKRRAPSLGELNFLPEPLDEHAQMLLSVFPQRRTPSTPR